MDFLQKIHVWVVCLFGDRVSIAVWVARECERETVGRLVGARWEAAQGAGDAGVFCPAASGWALVEAAAACRLVPDTSRSAMVGAGLGG